MFWVPDPLLGETCNLQCCRDAVGLFTYTYERGMRWMEEVVIYLAIEVGEEKQEGGTYFTIRFIARWPNEFQ